MTSDSVRRIAVACGSPLRGIKILDLTVAVSGPYSVALLADQGASVVKVERPGIGDIARWLGVSVNQMSALFVTCNRGKRSIALDLSHPKESRSFTSSPPMPTWWSRTSAPV